MGVVSNIDDLYRTVQALIVLHNMCIDFGDTVDGFDNNYEGDMNMLDDERFAGHQHDFDDEYGGRAPDEDAHGLLEEGRVLRDHYLNLLG